jgi:hypothetical protein
MSSRQSLVGVAIAAITTLALVACTTLPPPPHDDPIAIDAQYGIPAGSVPSYMLRPDGLMTNGLLPAQPNDTGG